MNSLVSSHLSFHPSSSTSIRRHFSPMQLPNAPTQLSFHSSSSTSISRPFRLRNTSVATANTNGAPIPLPEGPRTEVTVKGARNDSEAVKFAQAMAYSDYLNAFLNDANSSVAFIIIVAGYAAFRAGMPFKNIKLGDFLMMKEEELVKYDSLGAQKYLENARKSRGVVKIEISVGDGPGSGQAWSGTY